MGDGNNVFYIYSIKVIKSEYVCSLALGTINERTRIYSTSGENENDEHNSNQPQFNP